MKRSFLSIAIVMVVLCMFTSCTVTKTSLVSMLSEYTTEFVGKPHNYIVTTLGAPDRQTSDGAGGTILIYEKTITTSTSKNVAAAYNVNYLTGTYTPGTKSSSVTAQNTSYIHLFVGEDGVCYNVKTNHQKVVTEVDEMASKNRKVFGIMVSFAAILALVAIGGNLS